MHDVVRVLDAGRRRQVGVDPPVKEGDPGARQTGLARVGEPDLGHDGERLGVDVGLQEAVEQHEGVGADLVEASAIAPTELKCGPSFTATGTLTASFTLLSTST